MKKSIYTIMIVDADEKSAKTLGKAMDEIAEVVFATNGEEALSIAQSSTVSLIMLEAVLPDMDGFTVCKRLTGDRRTKNIPVFFVTGKDLDQDVIRGLELGAVDYVSKPFFPHLLKTQVMNVLGQLPGIPTTEGTPPTKTKAKAPPVVEETPPPETEAPPVVEETPPPETESPTVVEETPPPETEAPPLIPEPQEAEDENEFVKDSPKSVFSTQNGIRAIMAVFLILAGVALGRVFDPRPQQPAPIWKRPPATVPSEAKKKSKESALAWLKKTNCKPVPKVAWWGTVTHASMAKYVQRKHNGDWTPYIAKWERQLLIMKDVFHRNAAAKTNDGTRLEGRELEAHVANLQARLDVILCLAEESAKNN